ncbi:hypothetical protein [Chryseobacterium sp. T20]|uniref:hypothetical protein n=1 Tax=Chryseobacterium sp. T20 TaxID=3395375 RepID=UPI0039BCE095
MKKMFTLRGVSNTGKTTKVKQIAQWVIDNYPITNPHNVDITKDEILGTLQINKLRIGFLSAGDDLAQVKKIEKLLEENDDDIDIVINACRTRGAGRKYLEQNFNRKTGWLTTNIYVEKLNSLLINQIPARDAQIIDELKTWLTGLEKH